MLKKQVVSAIMPLAEMLSERNVRLETCAGSPIGNLTMASATLHADDTSVAETLVAVSSPVDTGRRDNENLPIILPSEHGFVQARAAQCIAAGVKKMITNARSVVIPAINATREYVDQYVADNAQARSIIPEVDVYNYDPLWAGALVDGIATQYDKVDLVGMPSVSLPALTDEQLHALVNSGSQEVRDFISREDKEIPGHLSAIWQIWFQGQPVSDSDDFRFLSRMLGNGSVGRVLNAGTLGDALDTRKGYDAILSGFLIANALYDNPVAGVQWGMDLPTYNLAISAFKAHFGKVIGRVYRARVAALESKTLIINMPIVRNWQLGQKTDNILLNGDVHKWYLQQGGTIEAIIGDVFSQRQVSARTILDLRPQYEAAYNNVVTTYTGLGVSNKYRYTLEALTKAAIQHVVDMDQDYWKQINPDCTKQEMIRDIQNYLASNIPVGTSEALDKVITYVFASFIYCRLRVDEFIAAMNNYPDQTLSPKAIASHVVMDMVIKSLMNDVYYNFQS